MGKFTYESNKIRLMVDGVQLNLVGRFEATDDYALEAVSGIGDIHVIEHVPTIALHRFTLNGYVEKTEKTISMGIIPENGDVALRGKTFHIEIFDTEGPLLRKYEDAMCNNGSSSADAHRLYMKGATFHALDTAGKQV